MDETAFAPNPIRRREGSTYRSDRKSSLRDVWEARELVLRLVERNLKVKYQRSALGFVWTLFNPLGTVIVLIAVFSYVVRIPIENYWAFLVSGYFVFNFVLQMLNTAARVLPEHAQLTRSAPFPNEVLIFSATIARLFEFAISLAIVLLVLVVFHHGGVPASLALLPVLIIIQLLLVIGIVMPLAIASVFFLDIEHALPVVSMTLFYLSPVFYPLSFVPEAVRPLWYLNPLTGLLTLYQMALYEGVFPPLWMLGVMTAVSAGICLGGYRIFIRYKALCAEIV